MAEHRVKGGHTLTDEDFERMADEAERGEYPGVPGAWVVRPQSRQPPEDEELVTIAFKVPRSQRDALDRKAASCNETRGQFMRAVLEKALSAE